MTELLNDPTVNAVGLAVLVLLVYVLGMWLKGKAPPRDDLFTDLRGEYSEEARTNFYSMWFPEKKTNVEDIDQEVEL